VTVVEHPQSARRRRRVPPTARASRGILGTVRVGAVPRYAWVAVVCALIAAPAAAAAQPRKPATPAKPAAPAPAPAPADAKVDPKADPKAPGKPKVFDFTGLDIAGRLRTPQLLYFLDRASEELERASLERRSFIPEMVRSIDETAL
jgi:hypothetical protein